MHGGKHLHSVGIEIMPEYCREYLQRQYQDSFHELLPIFSRIDQTKDFPEMERLLHEVEQWRGDGMAAALYYESKVMEAIRLVVEYQNRKFSEKLFSITAEDEKRLVPVGLHNCSAEKPA